MLESVVTLKPSDQNRSWLRYASKSKRPVPLDASRYPTTIFDGRPIPKPDWACRAPDGGIHIDVRVGRIDLHVSEAPYKNIELNWSKDYSVTLIARSWIDRISDLIDGERVFLGSVLLGGELLGGWRTMHGLRQPVLISDRMTTVKCPNCGEVATWPQGHVYFRTTDIEDQKVLVNMNGIYVRSDVVELLNLTPPRGSFKPDIVRLKTPT